MGEVADAAVELEEFAFGGDALLLERRGEGFGKVEAAPEKRFVRLEVVVVVVRAGRKLLEDDVGEDSRGCYVLRGSLRGAGHFGKLV